MPRWKQLLLNTYYLGTLPGRASRMRALSLVGKAPVMVLFYHRIADTLPNPWTASNAMFARQIQWLKRHFDMVSLAEAQGRICSGVNHRPAVSITFDDGYADNCDQALPLLIAEHIPCTYFVATRHILEHTPFPHDVARRSPLKVNTARQLRELADAGIEIGAHTRNHADLGQVTDPAKLFDELAGSRDELEQITGRRVRYFAFPYGQHANLSAEAFALAADLGYEGVCSAYGGFNFPGDDAFHLQRIHVDDDMIRLKNWVTLDARKLRTADRYEYQPPQAATEFAGELV